MTPRTLECHPFKPRSVWGRAHLGRHVRRLGRTGLMGISVDAPSWALDPVVVGYLRALGLTSKWEAVGRTDAELFADLHRLGRAKGLRVMVFGSSAAITGPGGQMFTVRCSSE